MISACITFPELVAATPWERKHQSTRITQSIHILYLSYTNTQYSYALYFTLTLLTFTLYYMLILYTSTLYLYSILYTYTYTNLVGSGSSWPTSSDGNSLSYSNATLEKSGKLECFYLAADIYNWHVVARLTLASSYQPVEFLV